MSKRAHYEKYKELAKRLHIAVTEESLPLFGVRDKEHLRRLYEADPNLNNIPLGVFDRFYASLRLYRRAGGMSMSESCCLYKHLLIHQVLGVPAPRPDFDLHMGSCPKCGVPHAVESICHCCGHRYNDQEAEEER